MKKQFKLLMLFAALFIAAAQVTSCKKSATTPPPTPTPASGKFTATLGAEAFSAPDAYIMPALGGTIAVMAKDAKGRSFSIAIFEKDFPVNKAVEVAFSPSISYSDEKSKTYIAKSGSMTITEYGKNSSGTVIKLKGTFSITVVSDGAEIIVKDGIFDVSTK
ncbi:MAG: hypothetical protein WC716_05280 [Chitinophagaceae bacterium]|jgi:hypothetical protein